MALRFAVLFNEVIFALSGSFVLVGGMTPVFHSVFRETMNTPTMLFLLACYGKCYKANCRVIQALLLYQNNILHCAKRCNGVFLRCLKCMHLAFCWCKVFGFFLPYFNVPCSMFSCDKKELGAE